MRHALIIKLTFLLLALASLALVLGDDPWGPF
jgi:hypothetical protein